jgi:PAS domain S-box-containing protein
MAHVLREWRADEGLDRPTAARRLAISYRSLQNYEAGRAKPRPTTLRHMAKTIGVDCHDLMTGTRRRNASPREVAKALIERLPAISYVAEWGPEGRWPYVSPQVDKMFGFTAEEWREPGFWASRVHPEDRARVFELERMDVPDRADSVEYRLIAKDGRVVWVRDTAFLRVDPDGPRYYEGVLLAIDDPSSGTSDKREQAPTGRQDQTPELIARLCDQIDELRDEVRQLRFEVSSLRESKNRIGP